MELQSATNAYHSLIAAIIERAIADLKEPEIQSARCVKDDIDQAMAFILSDDCEYYCLELEIDCGAIREKAAALYRKVIAKKEKPRKARYANTTGQLPSNRALTVSKKETVQSSVIFKGQSGARRSSFPAASIR